MIFYLFCYSIRDAGLMFEFYIFKYMLGTLYIVSTPIGNLDDITYRAISTLKEVDYVFCEDTRVTKKLLSRFEINTPVQTYHQHSDRAKYMEVVEMLKSGTNIALVTDAGTPGISDPGNELIEYVYKNISDAKIVPIPGASAVITALSVSGFPTDKFVFMGFPPHKNKRKKFFLEVMNNKYTTVLYESSHRIEKTLRELSEVLEEENEIVVGRELTKKFESFYRGKISDVANMKIPAKGEFVIIIRITN